MEKVYRLFVINPGSTSTRVAYYENDREVKGTKLVHPSQEIAKYRTINDQLPMRRQMVLDYMEEAGIHELDAIVSRGGRRPAHPLRRLRHHPADGRGVRPGSLAPCL